MIGKMVRMRRFISYNYFVELNPSIKYDRQDGKNEKIYFVQLFRRTESINAEETHTVIPNS
jgi:hypothetical protein